MGWECKFSNVIYVIKTVRTSEGFNKPLFASECHALSKAMANQYGAGNDSIHFNPRKDSGSIVSWQGMQMMLPHFVQLFSEISCNYVAIFFQRTIWQNVCQWHSFKIFFYFFLSLFYAIFVFVSKPGSLEEAKYTLWVYVLRNVLTANTSVYSVNQSNILMSSFRCAEILYSCCLSHPSVPLTDLMDGKAVAYLVVYSG